MANYVLPTLPLAEVSEEVERAPGVKVKGAFVANALVSVLYGDALPEPSFTVGIQGRGTLNLPEAEFKQLLGTMAALYLDRYFPKVNVDVPAA